MNQNQNWCMYADFETMDECKLHAKGLRKGTIKLPVTWVMADLRNIKVTNSTTGTVEMI
jgi:hypothetical protein